MQLHDMARWQHKHHFHIEDNKGEQNTWRVILLTLVMMIVEIVAGFVFGSMALLADGWHMGTHVIALGITTFSFHYARRHADDPHYSFGTGKVGSLGGYTSAIALGIAAVFMVIESSERLISPQPIRFNEAILVACVGLAVNLVSAFLLEGGKEHDEGEKASGANNLGTAHRHDHALRGAYLHVLADAVTSIAAIIALLTGKFLGWAWMDPLMGIVGSMLIGFWSFGLLQQTSGVLLDKDINPGLTPRIKAAIEQDSDNRVADLHVWRVGADQLALILSIVTDYPKTADYYKELLKDFEELAHVSVEINRCDSAFCVIAQGKINQPSP
jgi:cation diffusion facilitator family transporter